MPGGGADPDSKFTLKKRWGNCVEQLWEQMKGLAEDDGVDLGKALKDSWPLGYSFVFSKCLIFPRSW